MKQLFPAEIQENSIQSHWVKRNKKSRIIYLVAILTLTATIVSLPFIYIDVSTQSRSIVRSPHENNILQTVVSGEIKEVNLFENKAVQRGDTLLVISTDEADEQAGRREQKLIENRAFINDINLLLHEREGVITPKYKAEQSQFLAKLDELQVSVDQLQEEFQVSQRLYENNADFTKQLNGDIRFEHITFSYGTRTDVFEDFCLQIPQGKITAIIGESGSGKTTLAALLQKLYSLNKGKIFIGEHNLDYFSNNSMRECVATVPQQLDLFSGTIIENIALGEYEPDMERIVSICKELGIISFIENLPHGFHTRIGEHGVGLSGGEKQRIAIARALYRNPEILIMDEATSSLDSQSEHEVQQAIYNFNRQGKTVIIIAHRLSTVMNADKIVILEKGELIEEGTHAGLYTEGTKYYALWQKQIPVIR